jgi:hypothetical protein
VFLWAQRQQNTVKSPQRGGGSAAFHVAWDDAGDEQEVVNKTKKDMPTCQSWKKNEDYLLLLNIECSRLT